MFNGENGEILVQKGIGESETDLMEMSTSDEGPLYFALLSADDLVSGDSSSIHDAKNKLEEIYSVFPEEVKALNGKTFEDSKAVLEKLEKELSSKQIAA